MYLRIDYMFVIFKQKRENFEDSWERENILNVDICKHRRGSNSIHQNLGHIAY